MPISRRSFLGGAYAQTQARASSPRPNVVMFMTDDHGAWATGAYGCREMHTPNIDRLAAGGTKFSRAFACTPVCSPSRVTYLTGTIPSRNGVQDWLVPDDSYGPTTRNWYAGLTPYSEVLARNGYSLGMCGKWHMGKDDQAQAGFNYWATIPGGGGTYRDPTFVVNGEKRAMRGYKTDLVADHALDFLSRQNNDRPFYLLIPFYAPHTPFDYQPDEYRKGFDGSRFSCFPRTPMNPWQNPELARNQNNEKSMHAYSALIAGVDHNVGRVVNRLEEMGVRDNTLVIFTADQGWNAGHHGVWGKGNGTVPFNMYEESLRVPMIWNHPGHIRAGQTLDPMISSYDYFPTILDYLGVPEPPTGHRVGHSYAGFLRGRPPQWRNRLYFEYSYVRGVRTENLKYIERTKEWPSELYDLEADPGETRNVIGDPRHRKQLEALRKDLGRFFSENGAPPIEEWRSTTKQNLTVYRRP
ncbi:MAG: sulfatase-like hydrolase/transferase [Bryobacteraceae bacterium]